MSIQSYELLIDTSGQFNVVGPALKGDGFYGFSDGLHTISVKLDNFTGRFFLEATLELHPTEDDWFPIMLTGTNPYVEYPINPHMPTGSHGDTGMDSFVIEGNFVFIRAKINRDYVVPTPITPEDLALLGSVTHALMNF